MREQHQKRSGLHLTEHEKCRELLNHYSVYHLSVILSVALSSSISIHRIKHEVFLTLNVLFQSEDGGVERQKRSDLHLTEHEKCREFLSAKMSASLAN